MPKNDPPPSFPRRGIVGGFRELWDDPDDHPQLREQAIALEQRQQEAVARLAPAWRAEIRAERRQRQGDVRRAGRDP